MRVISHSEYNVDEHNYIPHTFPQPMTDRCKSVCFWSYFPLFSVKVAANMLIIPWGNSLPLALGDTQP